MRQRIIISTFVLIGFVFGSNILVKGQGYVDKQHFSEVFNQQKGYRLYLPESYTEGASQYPVIYFFHGHGGRHFRDNNAKLEYEKIQDLVDKYDVILVMWDGNIEESESRPYNTGDREHVVYDIQMKDYFLELVSHIDATYRTNTDRTARGIIGYSMGGFMSFYMAGKYPDLVSAAVNLTGSVEFYLGTPENHTLYPIRYTYENLRDVQIRLHNSTVGELSSLNREVNKGALYDSFVDYEYWEFEGGHKVDDPGETVVFEKAMRFVVNAFDNPNPRRDRWSHYDLYDEYEVWGYKVASNKNEPGFSYLRNVTHKGFGFYTLKWIPNGVPIKNFSASVYTGPIYEPDTEYNVRKYNRKKDTIFQTTKISDFEGRLSFELSGYGHEIGIFKEGDGPKLTFHDYSIDSGKSILRVGQENDLRISILNLGEELEAGKNITYRLFANDESVSLSGYYGELIVQENSSELFLPPAIVLTNKIAPTDAEPATIKFILEMEYGLVTFKEEFDVPVFFEVQEFSNLLVDDGLKIKGKVFGNGNGDGIISPGEEVMIYYGEHRLQLFTDDPYVIQDEERLFCESFPARWNGNGMTCSSIIKISEDSPIGHTIEFLAKYETKEFLPIIRNVYWGRVTVNVK